MKNPKNNKRLIGKKAEELAALYLVQEGFTILEKNFGTKWGEIDIIAADNNDNAAIVFVEVKYRRKLDYGAPYESVGHHKQERLRRAAWEYILSRKISDGTTDFRFDVISVSKSGGMRHFKNAFL